MDCLILQLLFKKADWLRLSSAIGLYTLNDESQAHIVLLSVCSEGLSSLEQETSLRNKCSPVLRQMLFIPNSSICKSQLTMPCTPSPYISSSEQSSFYPHLQLLNVHWEGIERICKACCSQGCTFAYILFYS